jgi:hypothetical protein
MRGEKDEVEVGCKVAGENQKNLTADERGSTLIRKEQKEIRSNRVMASHQRLKITRAELKTKESAFISVHQR